jgi:hypothetical protein
MANPQRAGLSECSNAVLAWNHRFGFGFPGFGFPGLALAVSEAAVAAASDKN